MYKIYYFCLYFFLIFIAMGVAAYVLSLLKTCLICEWQDYFRFFDCFKSCVSQRSYTWRWEWVNLANDYNYFKMLVTKIRFQIIQTILLLNAPFLFCITNYLRLKPISLVLNFSFFSFLCRFFFLVYAIVDFLFKSLFLINI